MKILLVTMTLFLIGIIPYKAKGWGKWLYHDILGWHEPSDILSFDGCSLSAHCKHCGKSIKQDSQGNWF